MGLKRLAAPKTYWINKKVNTWVIKAMPGSHKISESIPLGVLLRDVIKVVKDAREAKKLLNDSQILVDGVVRNNPRFTIGFMDVVSILKIKKNYRVIFDYKGRIKTESVNNKDSGFKIVKVIKKMIKGSVYQFTTHDGRTIILKLKDGNKIKINDSLIIKIPSQEIIKHMPLKKDSIIIIKGGQHKGETAKVTDLKQDKVVLKTKTNELILNKEHIFVTGD